MVFLVLEVPGSIPSQGPRHTKDIIKMEPVVPLFSTQHVKGNTGSFSRIKIGQKCNGYNLGQKSEVKKMYDYSEPKMLKAKNQKKPLETYNLFRKGG